ncbi:acyltransferase family protein [Arthrobacter globiformis]|uniref:acyltransferase n=1 Tax=Arthrobacter globiformis TaxID=1665 RepID=UPI0039786C66
MPVLSGTARAAVQMPETGPTREYGLDILRVVSICGVVGIHVFGYMLGRAPRESRPWWIAAVLDVSWIWVVPVFVMISGALILGSRMVAEQPGLFYRRRAVRLIPALIAWNLVYLIGVRVWMRGEDLTPHRSLQLLVDGSVFTQLYFLWLIAGLYAVAPVLAGFLRAGNETRAAKMAAAFVAVSLLFYMLPGVLGLFGVASPIRLNFLTHWMPYVGYFLAGYALRNVRLTGLKLTVTALATAAIIAGTVWHYGNKGEIRLLDAVVSVSYLGIGVALAALGVFVVTLSLASNLRLKRTAKPLTDLSNATFGVFLVHLVIFEAIRLQFPAVAAGTSIKAMVLAYAATLVGSFAVSTVARRVPVLRSIF